MSTYTEVFGGQAIPPAGNSFAAYTLVADTQFYWPQLAIGDNVVAATMDVSSTGAWKLALPDASVVSVGQDVMVNNRGANAFTLTDSLGSVIAQIEPGIVKYVYLTDNTTVSGTWTVLTFGAGTSGADASMLAGLGLKALNNTLNQESLAISTAASATVPLTYRSKTLIYSPTTGGIICTLPSAANAGDGFFFNVTNQGTGALTIDPYSTELIDSAATKVLAPAESCTLVTNGVKWVSIGYGRSTQFQFTKLVFDISTGGPFTLTSVQAQNKLISFIGTITAPVIVNLPPIVAVYYLQNDYTGAFSLTAKTVSGLGANTLPGVRTIVTCDGVNVIQSQTSALPVASIDGGTAGAVLYQQSPNLTGFTAVGTTGQLLVSNGTSAPSWTDSPILGTASPLIEGIPVAGTSIWGAHEDHVHPTIIGIALPLMDGTVAAVGVSTKGSHEDHVHQVAPAANIPNTPAGTISATNVQAALNELDTETQASLALKANLAGGNTFTGVQVLTATLQDGSIAVTQLATDFSDRVATTHYVHDIAMNAALPSQDASTAGKVVVSNGDSAHWDRLAGNSLYLAINLGAL